MINLAGRDLTTILFHRFFFGDEAAETSRDRLKRQCEWLRKHFTPVDLGAVKSGLKESKLPPRPLLVTIDDAKIEILRVADIFAAFELPVAIFACVGWCGLESPDEDNLLARLVNVIEWYRGPVRTIDTRWGRLTCGGNAGQSAAAIDSILVDPDASRSELQAVLSMLGGDEILSQRITCSWAELAEMKGSGAAIGGHSTSHINLAEASEIRMKFEIEETRRILCRRFGECDVFAYPYGMSNTFNQATTSQLKRTGFRYAFLTHSDFANSSTDPLKLPRISMPDRPMSHAEFCLRATGGGVVYRKLKQAGGGWVFSPRIRH